MNLHSHGLSLRAKTTFATMLILVCGISLVVAYAVSELRGQFEHNALEREFDNARQLALRIDDRLKSYKLQISSAAATIEPLSFDDPRLGQALARQYYLQQQFSPRGLILIDLDGNTIVDYPAVAKRRGINYKDRAYFRQAILTGRPYVDGPIEARLDQHPVLVLSAPVLDGQGRVKAVLAGVVDLSFSNFLGIEMGTSTPGNTQRYVVSMDSELIIASTDKTRLMEHLPPSSQGGIASKLRSGVEGAYVAQSSSGVDKAFGVARMLEKNWAVVEATPTADLFAPIDLMRNLILGGGAIVAALAALATFVWLGRAMRPLQTTARQLDDMSALRRPITPLEESGAAEVRSLIASFNRLAEALEERQRALDRTEHDLQEAERLGGLGQWRWHLATDTHHWSELIYRLYGRNPALPPAAYPEVRSYFAPDSWEPLSAAIEKCVAEGTAYQCDVEVARADGRRCWVTMRGAARTDERGKVQELFGTVQDITERKVLEQEIRRLNNALESTLDALPDPLFELDMEGRYLSLRSPRTELLAAPPRHLVGKTVAEVLPADAAQKFMQALQEALHKGFSNGRQIALDLPIGRRWFELSVARKHDHGVPLPRFVVVSHDITQRVEAQAALQLSETRYRTLLTKTGAVTWSSPPSGLHNHPQPEWMAFTGQTAEEMMGDGWSKVLHPDDLKPVQALWAESIAQTAPFLSEHRVRRRDGSWRWMATSAVPIRNESGEVIEWFGMSLDITDRKRSDAQIEYLAYHDQLTGLANRTLLRDRIRQALAAAHRQQRFGAILFVDLDRFKTINDIHGHSFGDAVLRDVASRLAHAVREYDTVARLGGDEFVILLPELSLQQDTAEDRAHAVAHKIRAVLDTPVDIDGMRYHTTASFGVTVFPKAQETDEDLLREADIALYEAKDKGRNAAVCFRADMQADISERYALENDLREAIERQALHIHLQNQVDPSGRTVGAELLLRWNHPRRGPIAPAQFIPLAEECGLISVLGEWVLQQACALIARLQSHGLQLRIAVNVSTPQFHQPDFAARVHDILQQAGADPAGLTLEVTESLLIQGTNNVVAHMQALSRLGVLFSIDDFGTGYSSLAYLKKLPIHELKIDRSFVQDITRDRSDAEIAQTILAMAHHLGLQVVAEGVENPEQRAFLATHGCDCFQGYLFHRPQAADEWLAELLAAAPGAAAARPAPGATTGPDAAHLTATAGDTR